MTSEELLKVAKLAVGRDIKIREILERDCTDITKFVLIRDLYDTKEVINEKQK